MEKVLILITVTVTFLEVSYATFGNDHISSVSHSCEDLLDIETCMEIRKVAETSGVAMEKINKVIGKTIVKDGKSTSTSEIYKAILQFVKGYVHAKVKRLTPGFGKRYIIENDFPKKIKQNPVDNSHDENNNLNQIASAESSESDGQTRDLHDDDSATRNTTIGFKLMLSRLRKVYQMLRNVGVKVNDLAGKIDFNDVLREVVDPNKSVVQIVVQILEKIKEGHKSVG